MADKILFIVCVSAVFIQSISAQCIGNALAADELALSGGALRYPGPNGPYGPAPYGSFGGPAPGFVAPASGGGFPVTSSSPISPTGISIISENAIEGALAVTGEMPFLGAVAFEGSLPTAGAGGINYGCGDGAIGIMSEGVGPYGPGIAPNSAPNQIGYGPGYGAPGYPAPGYPASGLGGYGLY